VLRTQPLYALLRSGAASKVRTLRLARRYDPRIDLRQRLGGLLPLLRACDYWTNAIDRKSNTHLSAVRFKSRLLAFRCDLGAGAPGGRLSTQWSRQPRGQKAKDGQRYRGCAHPYGLL
jgi:hypothetical protein